MEIKFENKVLSSFRELSHQLKRIQESAESVVPDTNEDIGRIASVHSSVLLKSKDVSSRGVIVTGEAEAVLIYITENENNVSYLRVSTPFSMEYEIHELQSDAKAHINLQISNTEARVLNPRKVSVSFELLGELSCYCPEDVDVDIALSDSISQGIHLKYETASAELPNAVCEKSFAVNEQYVFSDAKPLPEKLIFQDSRFCIEDKQLIGSKIILKGSINTDVCYFSQESPYPVSTSFSSPFSQIVDTGMERMDSCSASVTLTSAYYELIDTIGGEKALDSELHAVIQLVSRSRESIRYISDAYCNTMPAECTIKNTQLPIISEAEPIYAEGNEEIEIADDCGDIIGVYSTAGPYTAAQGQINLNVNLDIIYKTKSGSLSSARRTLRLEAESPGTQLRIYGIFISECSISPSGSSLRAKLKAEIRYLSVSSLELARLTELVLNEEKKYELSRFPALHLVNAEGESIWELAKTYHSSPECIERLNNHDSAEKTELLLIPKEI